MPLAYFAGVPPDRRADTDLHPEPATPAALLDRVFARALSRPVHSILGQCEMLRRSPIGEIYAEPLEAMRRAAVDLAERIEAALAASALEAASRPALQPVDLERFFQELAASIPGYWTKNRVLLRWQGSARGTVRTDADKLKFIFRHLVRNALKSTDKGFVSISLSLIATTLVFTIQDTGPGIPADLAREVRALCLSGELAEREPTEIGLGLVLVCRFVRSLRGDLTIDEPAAGGAKIHICIPVEELPESAGNPLQQ